MGELLKLRCCSGADVSLLKYGCLLLYEFIDYAYNYSFPWSLTQDASTFEFNVCASPNPCSSELKPLPGL